MRVHVLWIGEPSKIANDSFMTRGIFALLRNGNSISENLRSLPSDVAGTCSFLENLIQYGTHEVVEVYFHCYARLQERYSNFFSRFCKNMLELHNRITPGFLRSPPKFYVVSIEESINLLRTSRVEGFAEEFIFALAGRLTRYLNFVMDRRIRNVRHRVNFRDMFNYCVLYLYGGYVFDANVFALPQEMLKPYQTDYLATVPVETVTRDATGIIRFEKVSDVSSLAVIAATPLLEQLEPVLLLPSLPLVQTGVEASSRSPRHWQAAVNAFEDIRRSARFRRFIGQSIDGNYFVPFGGRMPREEDSATIFETDFFYDIYTLRCVAGQRELFVICEFLINRLIQLTCNSFITGQYPGDFVPRFGVLSMELVLLAPFVDVVNKMWGPFLPGHVPIHLRNGRRDETLLLTVDVPEDSGAYYFNLPLFKLFTGSHYMQTAYLDIDYYRDECRATSEHLLF